MVAPVGSVEFDESDELERLRRRAYGPDADIAGDAGAQVRLSELEAARRRQLTPVVGAAASSPAPVWERVPVPGRHEGSRFAWIWRPQSAGGSVTEQDPADRPTAASDPIAGVPAAPWWRRRRFVILSGAIAALALNAAIVVWTSQLLADWSTLVANTTSTGEIPAFPVGQRGGYYVPAPDYALALKSVGYDADVPNDRHGILNDLGISPDQLRRYEDFQGLNVWSGESSYGMVCLFVALPVQGLREGLSAEGCALRGLDTIADLQRGGDRHTRFVLRGDHVNVYVYKGAADPNASHG